MSAAVLVPMGIDLFIKLIAEVGVPLALKLHERWGKEAVVTPELILELHAFAAQTARGELLKALSLNGIALDDPRAVELLSLVPK